MPTGRRCHVGFQAYARVTSCDERVSRIEGSRLQIRVLHSTAWRTKKAEESTQRGLQDWFCAKTGFYHHPLRHGYETLPEEVACAIRSCTISDLLKPEYSKCDACQIQKGGRHATSELPKVMEANISVQTAARHQAKDTIFDLGPPPSKHSNPRPKCPQVSTARPLARSGAPPGALSAPRGAPASIPPRPWHSHQLGPAQHAGKAKGWLGSAKAPTRRHGATRKTLALNSSIKLEIRAQLWSAAPKSRLSTLESPAASRNPRRASTCPFSAARQAAVVPFGNLGHRNISLALNMPSRMPGRQSVGRTRLQADPSAFAKKLESRDSRLAARRHDDKFKT